MLTTIPPPWPVKLWLKCLQVPNFIPDFRLKWKKNLFRKIHFFSLFGPFILFIQPQVEISYYLRVSYTLTSLLPHYIMSFDSFLLSRRRLFSLSFSHTLSLSHTHSCTFSFSLISPLSHTSCFTLIVSAILHRSTFCYTVQLFRSNSNFLPIFSSITHPAASRRRWWNLTSNKQLILYFLLRFWLMVQTYSIRTKLKNQMLVSGVVVVDFYSSNPSLILAGC